MTFSAMGIGISVTAGGNPYYSDRDRKEQKAVKPKPIPEPKYHDVTYDNTPKDYSYGTSPKSLTSVSTDGRGSPNRSPKL